MVGKWDSAINIWISEKNISMCMEKKNSKMQSKHEKNLKNLNYFDVSLKAECSFSEL